MFSSIRCVPSNMIMDRNGCINSTHVRDPSWNLTEYVRDLKNELKIWKKVYWRLWSDCHLLHCTSCCSYFPLHQMSWWVFASNKKKIKDFFIILFLFLQVSLSCGTSPIFFNGKSKINELSYRAISLLWGKGLSIRNFTK